MEAGAKVRIEDILNRVESYRPDFDEDLLRHAYVVAAKRHQGQVRRSGEAYLIHPLTVAWILAEMELDEVAIAVGLLHDLLEDTETTAEELAEEFGPEVSRLVVALTKISTFESSFSSEEATEAENFRRLLLASTDDVRVILVKLADRLHNMRTLGLPQAGTPGGHRQRDPGHLRADRQPTRHRKHQVRARGSLLRLSLPGGGRGAGPSGGGARQGGRSVVSQNPGRPGSAARKERHRAHHHRAGQAPLLDLRKAQAPGGGAGRCVRRAGVSDHRLQRQRVLRDPRPDPPASGRRSRAGSRTTSRSPNPTPISPSTPR